MNKKELKEFYGFTGLFSNKEVGSWYLFAYIILFLIFLPFFIYLLFYYLIQHFKQFLYRLGWLKEKKKPVKTAKEIELEERERELKNWEKTLSFGMYKGAEIQNPIKRRKRKEKLWEELNQAKKELEEDKRAYRDKLKKRENKNRNLNISKNNELHVVKKSKPIQRIDALSNGWTDNCKRQASKNGRTINKTELITEIAKSAGLTKADAKSVVNAFQEAVGTALKKGEYVQLDDFGAFYVTKRKAVTCQNSRTGEKLVIPISKQPKFKASKELKDALN